MRTRIIDLKKTHPATEYLHKCMDASRAMRNAANFLIRNTMTGIAKDEKDRSDKEKEVLETVKITLILANERKRDNFKKKVCTALSKEPRSMHRHAMICRGIPHFLSLPTRDNWFLNYYQLDAICRLSKNDAYLSLPAQSNQKAIRKTVEAWKSYFESLKSWKKDPAKFNSIPRIPGYIRSAESTAAFTNQICKLKITAGKMWLSFPGCDHLVCIGDAKDFKGELVKVEVSPYYGKCRIFVTFEDDTKEKEAPKTPLRVLGIDPGLNNLLSCAGNFGDYPFIIPGGPAKARNQWFNKRKAKLCSAMQKGNDSKHSRKRSHKLDALSRKRDNFFRDYFYKLSHYICRYCVNNQVDVIVIGHNEEQKQDINLGRKTNQNFVSIPFEKLTKILKTTACKYSVAVIVREESYTSVASLLDLDVIPTYGKQTKEENAFSGKRMKRGVYKSSTGKMLNADINGAGNTARKEYPQAFENRNLTYLAETVRVVRFEEIYVKCKEQTSEKKAA